MIPAIIRRFRRARDARNRATVEAAWDATHTPATRAVDLWKARKAHLDEEEMAVSFPGTGHRYGAPARPHRLDGLVRGIRLRGLRSYERTRHACKYRKNAPAWDGWCTP